MSWLCPDRVSGNRAACAHEIVGSFIGGFLGYVLFGKDLDEGALQVSGIIGSIIGAVIALLIYRAMTHSRRRNVLRR